MTKKDWHLWLFLALLILSIGVRLPFWGSLNYGEHHWWTALSLNFASNWYEEGLRYLKGILYIQAGSVEFADPSSRGAFYSSSPLFILPLYILSKVSMQAPAIWMVNLLMFVFHSIFAFFAASITYRLSSDLKEKHRPIAFIGTAFAVLFSQQFLYAYSVVYWTDLFVLPFIGGVLYLEQLIDSKNTSTRWVTIQQLLILLTALADHYGIIFSLVLFAYLLAQGNYKRAWQVFLPILLVIGMAFVYISKMGPWAIVKGRVLSEFGLNLGEKITLSEVFSGIFIKHLGLYAFAFLLSFAVAENLQRKKLLSSKNLILFFLPPILFGFIFGVKSYTFELSALKFYLPIFIVIFGLLPALFVSYSDSLTKKKTKEKYLYRSFAFFPSLLTITLLVAQYSTLLEKNSKDLDLVHRLNWIKSITQPEQVIFSNHLAVNYYPPQGTYILRKPVWRFGGTVGVSAWGNIFRDAIDYPLLWLEQEGRHSKECTALYEKHGAKYVSSYENFKAFLFSSVKSFMDIPDADVEKCLKAF